MKVSTYPNESALVNDFVSHTYSHPLKLSNGDQRRFFIWGNEVWLPEGKSNTKSGLIDLIGTDEHGDVWLIEAKLCNNPKLTSGIWMKQIDPYRVSLAKRTESEIAMTARRFLIGNSANVAKTPYLTHPSGLYHAFEQWCAHWEISLPNADMLYNKTMSHIQAGNVISTVLADVADDSVWQSRYSSFEQGGGFSYIVFNSSSIHVNLDYHAESISLTDKEFSKDSWITFLKNKKAIKPTPSTVELYLANEVVPTYHKIMDSLVEMGWNRKAHPNNKAFIIDLPTIYDVNLRIHVGWVDADGSLDIKYRTPYSYGLKFNIDFRHFKKIPEMKEVWYPLAKRLVKEARYNGRRDAEVLNKRDLYEHEYESWDGEMYRMINKHNRDYIGREEETKDLHAVLNFLKDIVINVDEVPKKTITSEINDWSDTFWNNTGN